MPKHPTLDIEYAALMSRNAEGTFLYIPPTFRKFHPGSVGFFDSDGGWNQITDLGEPSQAPADGFTSFARKLTRDEPKPALWKTRSSESEEGQHIRLAGGVSAAAAAVPIDVSTESKRKTSSSGKAALVTGSTVMREKVVAPFGKPVGTWVSENARALLTSDFAPDIEQNGLWVVQSTWVTDECAIHMTNRTRREIDVGLDLAATGIGKAGGGGGTFEKLQNEGWTTYKAAEVRLLSIGRAGCFVVVDDVDSVVGGSGLGGVVQRVSL